jgi:hypothetical protein
MTALTLILLGLVAVAFAHDKVRRRLERLAELQLVRALGGAK